MTDTVSFAFQNRSLCIPDIAFFISNLLFGDCTSQYASFTQQQSPYNELYVLRIAPLTLKTNDYILNLEASKIQGDFQNFPLHCFLHSVSKLKHLVKSSG